MHAKSVCELCQMFSNLSEADDTKSLSIELSSGRFVPSAVLYVTNSGVQVFGFHEHHGDYMLSNRFGVGTNGSSYIDTSLFCIFQIDVICTNTKLAYNFQIRALLHHCFIHNVNTDDDAICIFCQLQELLRSILFSSIVIMNGYSFCFHLFYNISSIICKSSWCN